MPGFLDEYAERRWSDDLGCWVCSLETPTEAQTQAGEDETEGISFGLNNLERNPAVVPPPPMVFGGPPFASRSGVAPPATPFTPFVMAASSSSGGDEEDYASDADDPAYRTARERAADGWAIMTRQCKGRLVKAEKDLRAVLARTTKSSGQSSPF